MSSPLVYIIVLNWNGHEDTIRCVESLNKLDYPNFHIVVVDNGSSDDSVRILSQIDGITLIRNSKNLGFSGGNNVAVRFAMDGGADYVWLVNSDATAASDSLSRLVAATEADPRAGLASSVIYYAEERTRPQFCGSELNDQIYEVTQLSLPVSQRLQADHPERMVLWGTALLVRRAVIEQIGLLNEGLFAYYEDTDYSIRSINAGFLNIMVYDSSVWHDSPIESGLRKPHYYYYMYRNDILIRRNHIKSLVLLLKVLLWNFLRIRRSILQFKAAPQLAEACLAGLWDGWLGVTGVYRPGRRMPAVVRRFVLAFGPNSSLQRTDNGLCR